MLQNKRPGKRSTILTGWKGARNDSDQFSRTCTEKRIVLRQLLALRAGSAVDEEQQASNKAIKQVAS